MSKALTTEEPSFFEIVRKVSALAATFSFAFIETGLGKIENPLHVELVSQPGTVTARLNKMEHVVYGSRSLHLFPSSSNPAETMVIEYNSRGVKLTTEAFAELAVALFRMRLKVLYYQPEDIHTVDQEKSVLKLSKLAITGRY